MNSARVVGSLTRICWSTRCSLLLSLTQVAAGLKGAGKNPKDVANLDPSEVDAIIRGKGVPKATNDFSYDQLIKEVENVDQGEGGVRRRHLLTTEPATNGFQATSSSECQASPVV